jgi:hypothetical protein
MRGRNKRGPRLPTSFDANSNIQTFFINGNGHEITTSQREGISRKSVPWLFDPHTTPRVEKTKSRNPKRLLGTANDHDLLRFTM